ncbi:MAG: PIG-L deacetylase family protein [Actinomycetota bacterium]
MGRKKRVLTAVMITVAVIAFIILLLPVAAGRLFSRVEEVKDPVKAKANGRQLLKDARVVLAVGAHPDDLEYYTGGTLAVLAAEGKTVIGVLSADKSNIQATRRAESRKAASLLGYKPLFMGHFERGFNGGLSDKDRAEIRRELKDIIKKYKVDTVLAYDYADQGPVYHHIDHIVTGREARAAAKEAGVKNVYLYFSASPDTTVDISSVVAKKSEAMAAHVSQRNKWYMAPLRLIFGWAQPARSAGNGDTQGEATGTATSDDHRFGNTESFRRL